MEIAVSITGFTAREARLANLLLAQVNASRQQQGLATYPNFLAYCVGHLEDFISSNVRSINDVEVTPLREAFLEADDATRDQIRTLLEPWMTT